MFDVDIAYGIASFNNLQEENNPMAGDWVLQ